MPENFPVYGGKVSGTCDGHAFVPVSGGIPRRRVWQGRFFSLSPISSGRDLWCLTVSSKLWARSRDPLLKIQEFRPQLKRTFCVLQPGRDTESFPALQEIQAGDFPVLPGCRFIVLGHSGTVSSLAVLHWSFCPRRWPQGRPTAPPRPRSVDSWLNHLRRALAPVWLTDRNLRKRRRFLRLAHGIQ